MAKTLQSRYATYLLANGAVLVDSKSYKYIMLYHAQKELYYHLGNNGAVRYSHTGNITNSYSITNMMKAKLTSWERSI